MPEPVTSTIDVPGATLTYDVRGELGNQPVLLLIGSPMGASGFPTLASHLADRTIVTYDPRGVERSVRSDGAGELSPDGHAADLVALIETLDAGPVDLFASSGGAVNALALAAKRPDLINTLVAHEPPLAGSRRPPGPHPGHLPQQPRRLPRRRIRHARQTRRVRHQTPRGPGSLDLARGSSDQPWTDVGRDV